MEYGSFFSNMTDKEQDAWAKLSTDEREEIKRALEQEEKMKKDAEDAKSVAKAKAAQANAGNYSGDQFRFFPELRGDSASTEKDPLLLTDYRGLKGTAESLSKIPTTRGITDTGEGNDLMGLSAEAISLSPGLASAVDSSKSASPGWMQRLGLTKPLDQTLAEMAHKDRVIDKDEILERQGTELAVRLQMEEEAAQKQKDRIQAEEFSDAVEDPRVAAPAKTLMSKLQKHIAKKSDLEKGLEDRTQTEEFADAVVSKPSDKKDMLEMIASGEGLGLPISGGPGETSLGPKSILTGKDDKKEVVGEDGFEARWKKLVKKADEGDKKEIEKIQETVKQAVISGKPPPPKDGVKFDKRGYPIYAKGSEWGNKFKARFDKAVKDGETTFKWKGHDGVERPYTNDLATKTKTIKSVATEEEWRGPKKKTLRELHEESLKGGKDLDAQESKALKQSDAQAEENQKLYGNAKTEPERNKVIKKAVEKATTLEEIKSIAAELREKDKRGPDRYFVDPFTGWAMCLTCAERRKDRKQIMEIAATLPAEDRAVYYLSKDLIKQADFDLIVKSREHRDALGTKLTNLKIRSEELKIINEKIKSEKDPRRAEELKMFLNAGTTNNFELQAYLGRKLGLDPKVMKLALDAQVKFENDKLDAKKKGVGGKKDFADKFFVEYSSVVGNRYKWINNASSIIQTEGLTAQWTDLEGTKTVDRAAKFRSFGLYEQEQMKLKTPEEQRDIYRKSPYWKKRINKNKDYLKKVGGKWRFDPTLLTHDKDKYERYLLDTLVWLGMEETYPGQYSEITKYIETHSYSSKKAMAEVDGMIIAGADVKDDKK